MRENESEMRAFISFPRPFADYLLRPAGSNKHWMNRFVHALLKKRRFITEQLQTTGLNAQMHPASLTPPCIKVVVFALDSGLETREYLVI